MDKQKFFIVEFMEDMLSDWSFSEFRQMYSYMIRHPGNVLILTNFGPIPYFTDEESSQNFEEFQEFLDEKKSEIFWLLEKPLFSYLNKETAVLELNSFLSLKNFKNQNSLKLHLDKICLLDMRGESILRSSEKLQFDAYLFGGILGDHPPRDRTFTLREQFKNRRRLHQTQMSTDTALLATQMIIEEDWELEKIPFIENPELSNPEDPTNSVVMDGFVYVTTNYDLATGKLNNSSTAEPIMSDTIKNTLLFVEFEFDLF
jgi:ribosome biogenesis SPOUT family RNA methylase Rps3